ncbi:MAG: phosphotransferase, partial [Actinomycetia bacterium]|nr:phosphotransferase [Actinomycetes bacterium]
YRLGNTITTPDGTIHAVLDWELVTRGEPLADLGLLLTYWDAPAEAMLGASSPTTAPGSLTPDEVIATYVNASGRDVTDLPIYRALSCWRLSCLSLRTAARVSDGAMNTAADPRPFLHTCDVWAELAREQLRA